MMKKHNSLLLFLLIAVCTLQAQVFTGVRAGLTLNEYKVHYREGSYTNVSTASSMGWLVGVPINLKLNNVFSLQPELLYVTKGGGAIGETSITGGDEYKDTLSARFNYFELPLLLRAAVGGKKFRVFALTGVHASYLFNGKDSYAYHYEPFGVNVTPQILVKYQNRTESQHRYRRFDTGIDLGAGCSFKAGLGYLSLEGRWVQNFLPFNKGNQMNYNLTHTSFQFSAAYIFKFINKKE